jgi:MFS family permease
VGYPIGATVGGSIAAVLIAHYGWPAAFYFGAIVSLLMVPFVIWYMPESPDFLLAKRPAHALKSLNALLRGMGREKLSQLPEPIASEQRHAQGNPVGRLFHGELARSTILIWSSYFLLMFAFYFVLSWTPKLLVTAGLSKQQGITGGVLLNVGGIVGGIAFGYLASRWQVRKLTGAYLIITAITLVLFGVGGARLDTAFPIALLIGAFIFGSMAGLYALAPALYPPAIRTTGMGWAIGIGRIGAILAPAIVGLMIDGGWQAHDLYFVFALPLLAASLIVFALRS